MSVAWRVNLYQSVSSTMTLAHEASAAGAEEGYVIQALMQESGKGRHGNDWTSPMGNLYLSVLLRPNCVTERAGELAFVVAVALSAALDVYIDPKKHVKKLKWPNDILVDGLKISGILIETNLHDNSLDSVVIGMGLNIFKAPDLAVSLNDIAEEPVYINKVRETVLDKLSHYYGEWQESGFAPIRKIWLNQAHGLNEPMTARLPQDKFKGIFKGIDEAGSLILTMDEGDKIIHAGDVHFG